MTEPTRVEYVLHRGDRYCRVTRLIGERESNGAIYWTIESEPVSQRDEGEIIRSLTTEQLHEIGEIAGELRAKRGGRL